MDDPLTPIQLAQAIAAQYAALPQVTAVALAGSQTTDWAGPGSDIDLYVYAQPEVPITQRSAVAQAQASRAEVNNQFWEPGDEWVDAASGIHVDVMFRSPAWIEDQLDRILVRCEAWVGYSTCFWHNVLTSQPLFDRGGWYAALQERARQPYPEALVPAIVAKNYPILRNTLSSYRYQLQRAAQRQDQVSLNHRVAAVLASYFDILFAANRQPHPGEKRLVPIVERDCPHRPDDMRAQVEDLIRASAGDGETVLPALDRLVDGLEDFLQGAGLLQMEAP